MNLLSIDANPLLPAARGLEAGGSVSARDLRKIAAYLAINREMPLPTARNLLLEH